MFGAFAQLDDTYNTILVVGAIKLSVLAARADRIVGCPRLLL